MEFPLPFRAIVIADCIARVDNACALTKAYPQVPIAVLLRDPGRRRLEVERLAAYTRQVAPDSLVPISSGIGMDGIEFVHLPISAIDCADDLRSRGFRVGASVHDLGELREAITRHVEWVTFSPVLPTPSKPGHPGHGFDALRACCERAPFPVFALGGMTSAHVLDCLSGGAYGVAAISMFDRLEEGMRAIATIESFPYAEREVRCKW